MKAAKEPARFSDGRAPSKIPERRETARAALRAALLESPGTVRELSDRVGMPEKEVIHHLEHLLESTRRRADELGLRWVGEAAHCISCGFVFDGRQRLSRPGKCPTCRSTRIAPARFALLGVP